MNLGKCGTEFGNGPFVSEGYIDGYGNFSQNGYGCGYVVGSGIRRARGMGGHLDRYLGEDPWENPSSANMTLRGSSISGASNLDGTGEG